jgi:hypothetical protein
LASHHVLETETPTPSPTPSPTPLTTPQSMQMLVKKMGPGWSKQEE